MMKKWMAIMAAITILSTNAFALTGSNGGSNNVETVYVTGTTISQDVFDPRTETVTMSFNLVQASDVYAYVTDSLGNSITELQAQTAMTAGMKHFTWTGRHGNTANGIIQPSGDYTIKAVIVIDNSIKAIASSPVSIRTADVAPIISNLTATARDINVESPGTEIKFDVNKGARVKVEIKDGDVLIRTLPGYNGNNWYTANEVHSVLWDERDFDGNLVADGTYKVVVTASNDDGTDTEETNVVIDNTITHSGVIKDFTLDPNNSWDPTDDELELEFDLDEDVSDLVIYATKGNKHIEILDDEDVDDGDYTETWDGTDDDDGDYVDGGLWTITIIADGDTVKKSIRIEYEKPEISEAFVSKSSFDPYEDEFTNLLFKADATGLATVEVYKGTKREAKLLKDVMVRKNKWYAVKWDGIDDDGDEVSYGKDWKFKIKIENEDEDDEFDTATVEFDVEEDDAGDDDSNVTEDAVLPVIFDEDNASNVDINYCIDEEADVFIAIYEGKSTTGKSEIELLDYVEQSKGCHTITWNVQDEDKKDLKDGIYSYKIITKIGSHKDTERGKFVIGNTADFINDDDNNNNNDTDLDGVCGIYYTDMAYLSADNELCQAVTWVTEQNIFHGYNDGQFKPYQNINRAEVLKVVLEAFNVNLLSMNGLTEGFTDVDPYGWYMTYVRTAKFFGMLDGYGDGTARLANNINRVEFLKFVLQASDAFTGFEISDNAYARFEYADAKNSSEWFYKYVSEAAEYSLFDTDVINGEEYIMPGRLVGRGEVALVLYRMNKAGLLK